MIQVVESASKAPRLEANTMNNMSKTFFGAFVIMINPLRLGVFAAESVLS
jgi:hypothetical protein